MKNNPLGELHDNIMQQAYACADEFGFITLYITYVESMD